MNSFLLLNKPYKKSMSYSLLQLCCCSPGNPDLHEPLLSVNIAVATAPVHTVNCLTERVVTLENRLGALDTKLSDLADSNAGMMDKFTDTNARMLDSFAGAMADKTTRAFIDFEKAIAYELAQQKTNPAARRLSC